MLQQLVSHLLSVVLVFPLVASADESPSAAAAQAPALALAGTPPAPLARVLVAQQVTQQVAQQARDDAEPVVADDDPTESETEAPRRDVGLDDLEVLLGAWEATPYLAHLGPYEVTSRWERVLDGRFLKETRTITQGESVTEEWVLIGLPAGASELELWHFGSDGSSGRLLARPDAALRREGRLSVRDGALWSLAFEGVIRGRAPDGPWRLTLSVYEHGQYDLLVERKPGDNWLPITRQEFVRTAEADELVDAADAASDVELDARADGGR